jgi:hypothetical protein
MPTSCKPPGCPLVLDFYFILSLGPAEKKPQRKKMFGEPVVALSRVMIAIESRMTLMTSKDAFDGTHG